MKTVHEVLKTLNLYLEADRKYSLQVFKLLNAKYNSWIIRINIYVYTMNINLLRANDTKVIKIDVEDKSKMVHSPTGHEVFIKRFISNILENGTILNDLKNILYMLEDKEGHTLSEELWNDIE